MNDSTYIWNLKNKQNREEWANSCKRGGNDMSVIFKSIKYLLSGSLQNMFVESWPWKPCLHRNQEHQAGFTLIEKNQAS